MSFTDPLLLPSPPHSGVLHIPQDSGWWGRRYGYASQAALAPAEAALADADVVLVHGLYRYHFDWAVRVCQKKNLPYAIFPHGSLDPYVYTYRKAQKWGWLRWSGRKAIERANLVVFTTAREREKALKTVTPSRSAIIALPVTIPQEPPTTEQRTAARQTRGYDPSDCVFLCFGRLDLAKRPIEIIRAFLTAQQRSPHLRLLVVGPDSKSLSRAQVEQAAHALGARNVRFEGAAYGAEKESVLACSDVLVNFSHRENFGYVVCEALAAGIPAILSEGNDLGPELSAAGCVWYLDDDAESALSDAMLGASRASPTELNRMGSLGRSWTRRKLDSSLFGSELTASLSKLLPA